MSKIDRNGGPPDIENESPDTQDRPTNQQGNPEKPPYIVTDLIRANTIFYKRLRRRAKEADPNHNNCRAKRLMWLIEQERGTLARMRKEGISYEERHEYLTSKSEIQPEIRKLYLELGLAEMITLGDWSVNRTEEIPRTMGVKSFPEIEKMLLQFLVQNGVIEQDREKGDKVIHLDLGCGNGVVGETLRADTTTKPFDDDSILGDHMAEIGYADKIYFTLNDLLRTLLRDEYKDNPVLLEFINLIATLVIREVYHNRQYGTKKESLLNKLPKDPNLIRQVLSNLKGYIRLSPDKSAIKDDSEFLLDNIRQISPQCRRLIAEYLSDSDYETGLSGTSMFLDKYFKPELCKTRSKTGEDIEQLKNKQSRFAIDIYNNENKLSKELGLSDREITRCHEEISRAQGSIQRIEERIREKQALLDEKFPEEQVDLSGLITIYAHNVILGYFEEFGEIFPEGEASFAFVHSYRATSHAEDSVYQDLILQAAKRLKPGGIIIEDGKRESYTRFERLEELKHVEELLKLQAQLGPEYRIKVISDGQKSKSVVLERAVIQPDDRKVFFSDNNDILRGQELNYIPLEQFASQSVKIIFRNEIIKKLRALLIDPMVDGVPLENRFGAITSGRMDFRAIHSRNTLDELLETEIFRDDTRMKILRTMTPQEKPYQRIIDEIFDRICQQVPLIQERKEASEKGAVLLNQNTVIRTFASRRGQRDSHVNSTRRHKASDLPRNLDIPDLQDQALEAERVQLVQKLKSIKEKTGKKPLVILEFDNCFSNILMQDSIRELLGSDADYNELVEVKNIRLKGEEYPKQEDGIIYVIGGSLNDAYDKHGEKFTNNFSKELLEKIEAGACIRALGVCFGSQSLLQAYGQLKGKRIRTEKGALEFGPMPVTFSGDDPSLRHLSGKYCSAPFTRSGYSMVDSEEENSDLKPIAFEGIHDGKSWQRDENLPPVGYSMLDGRVKTVQFHPEIKLTKEKHRKILRKHLQHNFESIFKDFGPPARSRTRAADLMHLAKEAPDLVMRSIARDRSALSSPSFIFGNNIDLGAMDDKYRPTTWLKKDIGAAFLVPTLLDQANSLLDQLGHTG